LPNEPFARLAHLTSEEAMKPHNPQRDEFNPASHGKLRQALAELHARTPAVPPEVDAEVLCRARRHLLQAVSGRQSSRPSPTAWEELRAGLGLWLGARHWARAGVVIVAGALVWFAVHARRPGLVEDLNRDGVVDMLDAFALARQLEQGQAPRPQWDLNGDGTVNGLDVQALATQAVRLDQGGAS
jgi:hypothetical protein